MEVEKYEDPAEFRRIADPLLLAEEAANNLILGVSTDAHSSTYESFHGWVIRANGDVTAAAAQTPPHNLILARTNSDDAVGELARAVRDIPGVVGCLPELETFISHYSPGRREVRQGIYQLTGVLIEVDDTGCRPASEADRDLLVGWSLAFQEEVVPDRADSDRAAEAVDHRLQGPIDAAGLWVLEVNGEPVSMSGYRGPTPNGIRIGPVYTPPEHRGRGYASRLVVAQSQWLLGTGRKFCFLYTDLDNPTSNSIYQRIGYEMVAESAEYSFSPNS